MKKFVLFIFLGVSLSLAAQHVCPEVCEGMTRSEFRRQMFEQKIVYFADQMQLSATERASFEALYGEYSASVRKIKSERRDARKGLEQNADESAYKFFVDVTKKTEIALAEARVSFISELEKIVSAEKIYKFHIAEKEFKNLLIKDIGDYKLKCKK